MGWLWSSGADSQESKTSSPPEVPAVQSPPSPSSTRTETRTRSYQPEKPLSRDELAEEEFQAFVSGLRQSSGSASSSDSSIPASSPTLSTTTAQHAPTSSSTTPSADSNSPSSSIHPANLVPKEMSCRTAFDYAFFCQSFGGQWVNVYRYGELRNCSERWSDFWFCMRTMSYPTEQREKLTADYHREKLDKYKGVPTSEDVWEMRTTPVRGAFEGDFKTLEREMKVAEEQEANNQATS